MALVQRRSFRASDEATIDPGKLRHLVQVQDYTDKQDTAGQPIKTWFKFADVHAEILPLSGRELFTAQEVFSEATVQINMRYLKGLRPTMRIVYGDLVYNILSAVDVQMLHVKHECLCEAGLIDG